MILSKLRDWGLSSLSMIWAFTTPVHALMAATGGLILFDLITGISKAIKTKEKITSNRMRHTISKAIAYQIAILSAFLLDTVMGMNLMASRVIAGVICMVECKSVLENVEAMTGVQLWAALIDKLKPPKTQAQIEAEKKKDEPPAP